MKQFTTILSTLLLGLTLTVNAQNWKQKLVTILRNADSVIMLSHKTTSGIRITKKERDEQDLARYGKLNKGIINLMITIDRRSVEEIIEILTRKNNDKEIEIIKSFIPHHAIIIYKNNIVSWLDIDFPAKQIDTSKDMDIEDHLSKSSWRDLIQMFKIRKFDF